GSEGDVLRPRAEQHRDEALARLDLDRDDAGEQILEVAEKPGLAFGDPDQRARGLRGHMRDAVGDAAADDLARDLVRDVEDGQCRQRRRDRERDLDARHEATSRGSRKWTCSRATVTSSRSSKPLAASCSTTDRTSSSGVEAPAVRPTVSWPANSSS